MKKRSKRTRPKSPKKSELWAARRKVKAAKRRRFVAGLIEGKSMRKAALEAGYPQSMADKAGEKILPGAQEEFQKALEREVPDGIMIERLAQGLNAKETKLAQSDGEFTDSKHLVAWETRRRYLELIAKLRGLLVERVQIGGSKEDPVQVEINVARDKLIGKLASE